MVVLKSKFQYNRRMMKKLYLSIDWESRSIEVTNKESWEEYKKYLVEEGKCGEYKDGDSFEIYDEDDEDNNSGMVELKIDEKNLVD